MTLPTRFTHFWSIPRPITRQSSVVALIYALQAVLCVVLLDGIFAACHFPYRYWAMISAVIVLQPVFQQSMEAAATRCVANLIGAAAGIVADHFYGRDLTSLCVAMVAVVALCELLRLEGANRTACASAMIVIGGSDNAIVHASEWRVLAVSVGCVMAVAVQYLVESLRRIGATSSAVESPHQG